jgi:hypothetical protein
MRWNKGACPVIFWILWYKFEAILATNYLARHNVQAQLELIGGLLISLLG